VIAPAKHVIAKNTLWIRPTPHGQFGTRSQVHQIPNHCGRADIEGQSQQGTTFTGFGTQEPSTTDCRGDTELSFSQDRGQFPQLGQVCLKGLPIPTQPSRQTLKVAGLVRHGGGRQINTNVADIGHAAVMDGTGHGLRQDLFVCTARRHRHFHRQIVMRE
jgi:hypothetical protein